jgi:hypothetical protein
MRRGSDPGSKVDPPTPDGGKCGDRKKIKENKSKSGDRIDKQIRQRSKKKKIER